MTESESDLSQKASENTSLLKNPVFLTAVFGAIIAAFANAYVAWINNNTLADLENHKEAQEQLIEAKKAEFARLLEVSKLDVDLGKKKLKALCDMLLVTDRSICLSRALTSTENTTAQGNSSANAPMYTQATWESSWVGGGHGQQEMCNNGISELIKSDQYKGRIITVQSSSEDSRKDFLGHVEYKYHCSYRVSNP